MTGWKRALARSGIALLLLLFVGATVQGVTTALERRRLVRPGQMVESTGHQLHIVCTGQGRPAVILDAGALGTAAEWAWVQQEVARTTRVCSYDRSGLGYSEAGDAPYDPAHVPEELHAVLGRAGIDAPYVLAGHGLGGAFVQLYADRYPDDVAGLVLVDALVPDQLAQLRPEVRDAFRGFVRRMQAMPWLARVGMLRIHNPLAARAAGLPDPAGAEARMFLITPDHLARSATELRALDRTLARLGQVRTLGTKPVVVITPGQPTADQTRGDVNNARELQARRAQLSMRGERYALAGATSRTILTDRTQAAQVAGHIRDVVAAAR